MEWKILKAEDYCIFVTDGTHDSPKAQKDGHYLITSKHLGEYRIDFSSAKKISEVDYQKVITRSNVEQWDILFSMIGTVGLVYLENNQVIDYACKNMGIFKMGGNRDNAYWLYYYLKSPTAKEYIVTHLRGSTQQYLPLVSLRNFPIPVPNKHVRDKIIKVLNTIDASIENNNKINENLYQQVTALYGSLFGKATQQTTSVGQYSEQIYSGGTPSTSKPEYWNGEFHWFSSGETRNRFVITTDKTITKTGAENSSTKLARKYDIVIASAGQGFTRGQTTMLLLDTYINQSVIVIHANRTVLPYLFWNLASRYDELRAISDSSSIRGSLTTKMIARFEIPDVDSEDLATFSDFAWAIISEIENNLLENERLSILRDTLLPRLMSGMLDVSSFDL